ncbi:hypothetical protein F4823DRAFT_558778 [Ustulina deusta]|nr:hypothetical protein F4823DRAFT_558778 [Ustulina deusta]
MLIVVGTLALAHMQSMPGMGSANTPSFLNQIDIIVGEDVECEDEEEDDDAPQATSRTPRGQSDRARDAMPSWDVTIAGGSDAVVPGRASPETEYWAD